MERVKVLRNIRLYYVFQIFKEPLFWGPILITYIGSVSGMDLSRIYFMESICLILLILLEVPSGALADLIGRKTAITCGTFLLLIDNLVFSLAYNEPMIWLANIIWVFGFSLVSGADSSLLYDSLLFLNKDHEFKKINGKALSYRFLVIAVCSIFVGYMAEINLRLPLFLGLVFMFFNFVVSMFFEEPPVYDKNKYKLDSHVSLMFSSLLVVLKNIKIQWMIGLVVVVSSILKSWFFAYNPYFELVELPIVYFGWLFFCLNIVSAISSHFAHSISKMLGELGSVFLIVLTVAIPVMVMGTWVCQLSCLMVLVSNISRGYMAPFVDHFLHHHIASHNRATVISIKSAANGLAQFVSLSVFGVLLNIYSLAFCLQLMGLVVLGCGVFFVISYLIIFKDS